MRLIKGSALLIFLALTGSACVPDIYLIDRQTVLELEASGPWPELDQKFRDAALKPGPTPLESTRDRVEERQIYAMTHDDASPEAPKTEAPKKTPPAPTAAGEPAPDAPKPK